MKRTERATRGHDDVVAHKNARMRDNYNCRRLGQRIAGGPEVMISLDQIELLMISLDQIELPMISLDQIELPTISLDQIELLMISLD